MRLLFVCQRYDHYAGGGEFDLRTFLNLFTRYDGDCLLITIDDCRHPTIEKVNPHFSILRVNQEEYLYHVKKQAIDYRPQIIGANCSVWGIRGLMVVRHSLVPKLFFQTNTYFLQSGIEREFLRFFYTDTIITNSQHTYRQLWNSLKKKSLVSLPLIDIRKYQVKVNSREYITMINYRIEKGKKIFDKISKLLPNEKFLAVRGWMAIKGLRKPLQIDNIKIVGPFEDMRRVYSQTRLLLIPSLCEEAFGRVALEAGINGIPVIASNRGGLKEAVGKGGVLINDYQNEKAWAVAIKRFEEREYYQKMSRQAIDNARRFDFQREYRLITEAMEGVLRQRRKFSVKIQLSLNYFFLRLSRFFFFRFKRLRSTLRLRSTFLSFLRFYTEDISSFNKRTSQEADVIDFYRSEVGLQKPEQSILNLLRDRLKKAKMLDIGVGAGRTTLYFANLVKEYIGIDYSEGMIDACEARFPTMSGSWTFQVGDARNLRDFPRDYFDFILFSFNGIDALSHRDRLKALKEIKRVGRPGGFFVFSSHNLNGVRQRLTEQFKIKLSLNLIETANSLKNFLLLKITNKSLKKMEEGEHAIISDGAHQFRLKNYYIKPESMINQLNKIGFKDIRVYSLVDGREIKKAIQLKEATDCWLYYLCNF